MCKELYEQLEELTSTEEAEDICNALALYRVTSSVTSLLSELVDYSMSSEKRRHDDEGDEDFPRAYPYL